MAGAGPSAGVQRQVPVLRFGLAGGEDLAGHGGQVEGLALVQARLPAGEREQRVDELLLLGAGGEYPLVRARGASRWWRRGRRGRPG